MSRNRFTETIGNRLVPIILLLMTSFPLVVRSFHCPILECACFYNGRETVKIVCPPEHHGVQYTITHHILRGELSVDCLDSMVYRSAMFRTFNFSNILHIHFNRCPPPPENLTFHDILQGLHPRLLNFNSNEQQGRVLRASLFANLDQLETLDLDDNGYVDVERANLQDDILLPRLQSLSLADNRFTRVPRTPALTNLPTLHGLTLSNNAIQLLADDDFENLSSLQILKLDHNQVESVSSATFHHLHALKLLRLDNNRIRVLASNLLHNLTHLQFLDLSGNEIERLSPQFLKDAIHLKVLRISRNRNLTELPEDLLWSLSSLEELDLSENNLTTLSELFLLHATRSLSKLNLRRNSLASLPAGFLANATGLAVINLSDNDLTSLPPLLFDGFARLRELNLSYNFLKSLPAATFPDQHELTSLDLNHNLLEEVHRGVFESAVKLTWLDLSYNYLTFGGADIPPFTVPLALRNLNMSNNMVTSLSLGWMRSGQLVDFNVSFNQIKLVLVKVGHQLDTPVVVDLRYNLVTTIEVSDASHLPLPPTVFQDDDDYADTGYPEPKTASLFPALTADKISAGTSAGIETVSPETNVSTQMALSQPSAPSIGDSIDSPPTATSRNIMTVMLDDNPISCDCNIITFVQHLLRNHGNGNNSSSSAIYFVDADKLTCTTPQELLNRHLLSVQPNELYCPIVSEHCSAPCRCIQRAHDKTVSVDCRQRELTAFPSVVPLNTTVLHLEGNNISSLTPLAHPMFANLTELYVSDNSLSSVTPEMTSPKNLRKVSLDNNRLEYLPEWFVEAMDAANWTAVSLGNNPWSCDCRNVAFQKWLRDNPDRVLDASDIVCRFVTKTKDGRHGLNSYSHAHLNRMNLRACLNVDTSDKTSVIIAAVLILVLTGVLILGSKLIFRNFFKFKLFLMKMCMSRPKPKPRQPGESSA